MELFYIAGVIGAVTALVTLVPQLYSAYRPGGIGSLKEIATFKLVNYAMGAVAWIINAIGLKSTFLIGSGIVNLLGTLALIF